MATHPCRCFRSISSWQHLGCFDTLAACDAKTVIILYYGIYEIADFPIHDLIVCSRAPYKILRPAVRFKRVHLGSKRINLCDKARYHVLIIIELRSRYSGYAVAVSSRTNIPITNRFPFRRANRYRSREVLVEPSITYSNNVNVINSNRNDSGAQISFNKINKTCNQVVADINETQCYKNNTKIFDKQLYIQFN